MKTLKELLANMHPADVQRVEERADELILQEAANRSLARVHQHVQDRNIGIISAHRNENSADENKTRHAELGHDIRKAGFGYVHVKGRYIENHGTPQAKAVDEHSYMVIGKKGNDSGNLKGFLTHHGEKYNQDSILHKPHNSKVATLHGTSKRPDSWPGHGNTHDVGEFHPNRAGEFHTAMKGKRTFAFESFEPYLFYNPRSFFSRRETLFDLSE